MTKQVTMNVGRKQYDEYEKKRNVTVRIYPEDQIFIKETFGSFQKFVDMQLNELKCAAMQNKKSK